MNVTKANSLHNYIAGVDKELDTKVVNAINNALTKIQCHGSSICKQY